MRDQLQVEAHVDHVVRLGVPSRMRVEQVHQESMRYAASSTAQAQRICTMISRRSKCPRVVEQCVLFLIEHHEVVVEVVRDLVERVEVVLEEVPVVGKVLCQVHGDSSIKLGTVSYTHLTLPTIYSV